MDVQTDRLTEGGVNNVPSRLYKSVGINNKNARYGSLCEKKSLPRINKVC